MAGQSLGSLTRAFTICMCDKYQFNMSQLKYTEKKEYMFMNFVTESIIHVIVPHWYSVNYSYVHTLFVHG